MKTYSNSNVITVTIFVVTYIYTYVNHHSHDVSFHVSLRKIQTPKIWGMISIGWRVKNTPTESLTLIIVGTVIPYYSCMHKSPKQVSRGSNIRPEIFFYVSHGSPWLVWKKILNLNTVYGLSVTLLWWWQYKNRWKWS